MKYLFLIVLVGAAAYFFFIGKRPPEKIETTNEAVRETEAAAVTQKPELKPESKAEHAADKAPVPPAEPVSPPAPAKRLAPEGTYYVVQRISVATDSGIVGIPPGTKVAVVRPGPPMRVTDGKAEFDVTPGQVTNDLDVANRVYLAVSQQQSQVAALKQVQTQTSQIANEERARRNAEIGEAEARRAKVLLELRARLPALMRKQAALEKSVREMRNAYYSGGKITYNGKHPSWDELKGMESDLVRSSGERQDVEDQIIEVQK